MHPSLPVGPVQGHHAERSKVDRASPIQIACSDDFQSIRMILGNAFADFAHFIIGG